VSKIGREIPSARVGFFHGPRGSGHIGWLRLGRRPRLHPPLPRVLGLIRRHLTGEAGAKALGSRSAVLALSVAGVCRALRGGHDGGTRLYPASRASARASRSASAPRSPGALATLRPEDAADADGIGCDGGPSVGRSVSRPSAHCSRSGLSHLGPPRRIPLRTRSSCACTRWPRRPTLGAVSGLVRRRR
jgi:hypothetical protein